MSQHPSHVLMLHLPLRYLGASHFTDHAHHTIVPLHVIYTHSSPLSWVHLSRPGLVTMCIDVIVIVSRGILLCSFHCFFKTVRTALRSSRLLCCALPPLFSTVQIPQRSRMKQSSSLTLSLTAPWRRSPLRQRTKCLHRFQGVLG